MSAAMQILNSDHRNLERLLSALERQIVHLENAEEADLDIINAIVEYCLTYPDLCHHPKEDLILRQLRLRRPDVAESIGNLEEEHHKLAENTRRFAGSVHQVLRSGRPESGGFAESARAFLENYRYHMEMEDTVFFPLAERHLTDEDWAVVDREVEQMVDPLFGGRVEERYKVLRNEILLWDEVAP